MILLNKKTDILNQSGGFWLGASVARSPLSETDGTQNWILVADCMEKSDGVKFSKRFRSDNGSDWIEQAFFEHCQPYDEGKNIQRDGYGALYADDELKRIFYFGTELYWENDHGEAGPTGMGYLQCGALIGRWNEAENRFSWDFGDWVTVPLEVSTRGLYEPSHALLPDGRILMVCRGSNYTKEDSIIGCKFFAVPKTEG